MNMRLITVLSLVVSFVILTPSTSFADAASDAVCDMLAASTHDTEKPANVPGVAFNDLKSDEAIAACLIAYGANPESARIAFQLGRAYDAANKEPEKQFELYGKAAEKGYVIGQYNFGRLHQREGQHKDDSIANSFLCKAAEAGFELAFVDCGYAYDRGIGKPKDPQKAMQWYQKGADSGDATALSDLGFMYETGNGVPKDFARAGEYYKQSAELSDTLGMNNYGNWLIQGIGVKQDVSLGMEYLKKSIAAGGDDAPVTLAETYDRGKEIPFDATLAATNYLMGLKLNGEQARKVLIEKAGDGIKPATLDAIQVQLKAEGKVFVASPGKFTPEILAVLKDYPAK
jgi:TPR repeat protein